jgi:hypothetical protein
MKETAIWILAFVLFLGVIALGDMGFRPFMVLSQIMLYGLSIIVLFVFLHLLLLLTSGKR